MTEIYELTEDENLTLEAAQERGIVDASEVLDYVWQTYGHAWPKSKATRLLSRLTKIGVMMRHPRVSAGWGQGWHSSAYSCKK